MELNLAAASRYAHANAEKAFADHDAEAFVFCAQPGEELGLVFDNSVALMEAGIYERALVYAWTSVKHNFHRWDTKVLRWLFERADRPRLLAAGDSLPGEPPFTLYRGVSGNGRGRKERGLSWTDSLDTACFFALRYPRLADPAIFTAKVRRVFCYIKDRDESEFVCWPSRITRLEIPLAEIHARRDRWSEARHRKEMSELAGRRHATSP